MNSRETRSHTWVPAPPSPTATEPYGNQGVYLLCCWTSSFILHTPQMPLEEGLPQVAHGTELSEVPDAESLEET